MSELNNRIASLIEVLSTGLVEREDHIKLMLLAALAGEHVLLIGPPGTAKSLLARRLRLAFREAKFFERLLTQFSVPEDLFGPYSLEDLDEGRYRRLTEGYLADADVGFIDEIFKANPSILNALLTLLNERVFHNVPPLHKDGSSTGDAPLPLPVPLKCLVGASNEVPEPGELDALYDRFLIRCEVGPVEDFAALLRTANEDEPAIELELGFSAEELATLRKSAKEVAVPLEVDDLLGQLRCRMAELQLEVSDRRWLKIRKLLRVAALTCGREQVIPLDVLLVPHCVWSPRKEEQSVTLPERHAETPQGTLHVSSGLPIEIRDGLTTWLLPRLWNTSQTGNIRQLEIEVDAWQHKVEMCGREPVSQGQLESLLSQVRDCECRIDSLCKRLRLYLESNTSSENWLTHKVVEAGLERLKYDTEICVALFERVHNVVSMFESLAGTNRDTESSPEASSLDMIDFTLPGDWSVQATHDQEWQTLNSLEEEEVSFDAVKRYHFRFKPPATPVNLVRLVRDFGRSPGLISVSLGGTYSPKSNVSDLSEIHVCKALERLDISRSCVSDLQPIAQLNSLREICCDYTPVESLKPLSSLPYLQSLSLVETRVTDIGPLATIRSLERVSFEGVSTLSDITPLRRMPWIMEVDLSRVSASDWGALGHLTHLETLRLNKTAVAQLSCIQHLHELRRLFLADTSDLATLEGIENLTKVEELVLPNTKVTDLAPLSRLGRLRTLVLANCPIEILRPLQGLSHLERLDLSGTKTADLSPLVHLRSLRTLNLKNVQQVATVDVDSLKAALPGCDIQQ